MSTYLDALLSAQSRALSLATNQDDVDVDVASSPPPSEGQTLVATGPGAATWQTPASGVTLGVTAPTQVAVTTAVPGAGTTAARSDHVHSVATAAPVALAIGGASFPGTSTSLARADHAHGLPAFGAGAGAIVEGNDPRLSDDRVASGVRTLTTVVATAGATAPSTGQVLTATGPTAATWQTGIALTVAPPSQVSVTAAVSGGATTAARADHVHSVATDVPVALAVGGSNAPGSSASLARADHAHGLPAFGSTSGTIAQGNDARLSDDRVASGVRTATTVVATAAASAPSSGQVLTATGASAATWQTPASGVSLATSQVPSQVSVTTAVPGTGVTAARDDHVHSVATAAPGALAVGGANVLGGSTSLARADHVHALPAFGSASGTFAQGDDARLSDDRTASGLRTASTVVATATATAPSVGQVLTATGPTGATWQTGIALATAAPSQVSVTAAVSGAGTAAAREDHVHSVATATPVALTVGGANAPGSSTSLARADHAHALPAFGSAAGSFTQGNDPRLSDDRTASGLRTATTVVATAGAAAPSSGQVLVATGPAAATWQSPLALTGSIPSTVSDTTAAVGVATDAARRDHIHAVSIGAPAALTVGGTQSSGSATSLARSDHAHAMPGLATAAVDGFMSAADKAKFDTFDAKASCRIVSTVNIALSGFPVIDGTTPAAGERVLVTGQTAASANGIYNASAGAWSRAADADTSTEVTAGLTVRVNEGTTFADTLWILTTNDPITLGTTALVFAQAPSVADKVKLDGVETGAQVVTFARVQTALAAASSAVSLNSQQITNVLDPTAAQHVATKAYVDAIAQGLDTKASCRLVATANVPALTGAVVIDGVTTSADRVLLTAQTTASANGIYLTNASGAWARAADADTSADVTSGMYTFITAGTANADSGWALITPDPIVLGTTALTFSQVTGAGQITAGAGVTKTGNQIDVVAHADGSIVVAADSVQVGILATDAQHGTRGGGTLHAVATTSVAGFQSALDKTKLDGVATGATATPLASTAPAALPGAAAVGVGTTAARADHAHPTDFKQLCRVYYASFAITTSAMPRVVDGVTLSAGDRVLVAVFNSGSSSGIYTVTTPGTGADGVWAKLASGITAGSLIGIKEGACYGGSQWIGRSTSAETTTPLENSWRRSARVFFAPFSQNFNAAPLVVDGITLANGDLVLVQYGANPNVTSGCFRVESAGTGSDGVWSAIPLQFELGDLIFIREGTVFGGTLRKASGTGTGSADPTIPAVTDAFHGSLGGAALHAVATTSAAGFLSSADKAKLDTLAFTRVKDVCDFYTDTPVTLSGTASFAAGLRVLVMAQADATTNGIYVTAAGAWARAADADTSADFGRGIVVPVLWYTEGSSGLLLYSSNTASPLVLGTTPIVFGPDNDTAWVQNRLSNITTPLALGMQRITLVADPVNDWDAATQGSVNASVAPINNAAVVPWIVERNAGGTLLFADEFLPGTNPDLASRGWNCANVATGANMARLGNVTWGTTSLTATQYNSTIIGSWLFIQTGAQMHVTRPMSAPFGCIAMRGVPSNPISNPPQRMGLLVADSSAYSTAKKLMVGFVNGVAGAQLLGASHQTGTGTITVGTGTAPTASNVDTDIFVASKQTVTSEWGIALRRADPPIVVGEYWSLSPALADTATVFGFVVDSGSTGPGQRHCAIDYVRRYPANTFFGY